MLSCNVKTAAVAALVAGACFLTNAENSFTERGSIWTGGSLGFSTIGMEGQSYRQNMLLLSPILRFFPANYFAVGPRAQITGVYDKYSSINQIGIGVDLAFAYQVPNSVTPYFRSGGQFDLYTMSSTHSGITTSDSYQGYTVPFAIGIIIPVGGIFAIQMEPSIQIKGAEDNTMNIFSISFGFAGIQNKLCVSTLQTLSYF